jgi:hypothetical protein
MKKQLFNLLTIVSVSLSIISCEGPEGPVGPSGTTGAAGTIGPAGAAGAAGKDGLAGKDGKIQATATPWLTLDFEGGRANVNSFTQNGQGTDYYITSVSLQLKEKKQDFLTKEVLDGGVVITYFKYNALLFDDTESAYSLAERISGGSATGGGSSSFKIEGRTTNTFNDFASCSINNFEVGEKFWNPIFNFSTPFNQTFSNNQTVFTTRTPELLNKTATFYRELAKKNAPKIRLVVIPFAAAGRMKAIDFSNYELVKKTFNIKD